MAMIKCPEPDCDNVVSDQAPTCPKCGCPVRRVEYKFVTVTHSYEYGGYSGKDEYEALLKDGWQVVEKRAEDLINVRGELYGYLCEYKLQR